MNFRAVSAPHPSILSPSRLASRGEGKSPLRPLRVHGRTGLEQALRLACLVDLTPASLRSARQR